MCIQVEVEMLNKGFMTGDLRGYPGLLTWNYVVVMDVGEGNTPVTPHLRVKYE